MRKSALPLKERDFTFANFGGNEFFQHGYKSYETFAPKRRGTRYCSFAYSAFRRDEGGLRMVVASNVGTK
jgi:hypothetical protein